MIESTFILLNGIGEMTERKLWRDGIATWRAFLDAQSLPGISTRRKVLFDDEVCRALEHWQHGRADYFATCLKPRDQWRLYEWLRPRAVYLDIETGGPYGDITVVGLYGHGRMTSLVRGENLTRERLLEELSGYDLIVTFFGSAFDLPYLQARCPGLSFPQPHIDLCFVARRVGLRGGLKQIEPIAGIRRPASLRGLDGWDAVRLWNRWRSGHDDSARELLLAYNAADAANLQPLADFLCAELAERCGFRMQLVEG
jgi:uncharacterized protein